MPTRPIFGEGRSRVGKKPSTAPALIYRGNEDSMSGRWLEYRGRPVPDARSRPVTVLLGAGQGGSRRGPYDRRNRVMLVEERALTSGVLLKEMR